MSEKKLSEIADGLERVAVDHGLRSFIKQLSDPFGPVDRIGSGVITMPQAMAHLESENAQLKTRLREIEAELQTERKRVAELEAKQCAHEAELAVAHEFIADLQAQLAWAPVSKGLPTEEGPYEFTHVSDDSAIIHDFELWLYNPHEDEFESVTSADVYVRDEFLDNNYYTHYRRIELPKDGES